MLPPSQVDEDSAPPEGTGASPGPLSPDHVHQLVLLYLALAYGTDHDLHPAEQQAIVELVGRWAPDYERRRVEAVVEAAYTAMRGGVHESAEALAQGLRPLLSPDLRRQVLTDLGVVAKADGWLSIREAALIGRVRSLWHESA
jgi:uncharacterized tellurite resistance protein B-like protein